MSPSKTLFYLCISFVAGITLASLVVIPQIFVWGIFLLGLAIITISFLVNKNFAVVAGFCVLVLVLGMMRFQITQFTIDNNQLRKLNDAPDKITLVGQISDQPDVREALQKLTVATQKMIVNGKSSSIQGNVLVTVNTGTYHYLDTILITGKLKTPAVFDDFNYKNYLLKDNIYSVMDYPKIQLVSSKHSYTIFSYSYEKILFFKEKLKTAMAYNFSGHQLMLLQGVLLGENTTMSQDLRDKLNAAGLRYLTAISGVHIIVISMILMSLFLALGFWRGQAFYFSLAFIWLYVALTGFTASGIRASNMGSIFLLAQKLGRQNTSARTITLAAVIMLLQNPLLLLYDVGFQLSFMASLGIIYFKPLLEGVIKIVTKEYSPHVVEMLSVTLTAQLFIAPIMIYNFGNVSLVAPLTSLLILPIMPLLMITGFLSSVAGIFSSGLGWVVSLPCWFLLMYFLKILDIFSQPWALATLPNISALWLVGYYAIVVFLIWYLQKYKKPAFLGY